MSIEWNDSTAVTAAAVAAAVMVPAALYIASNGGGGGSNRAKKERLPPMVPIGWWESVSEPGMDRFIETLKRWCETMDYAPVFRTPPPLPGMNFVTVCDPDIQREILTDATTRKPKFIFQPFVNNMGSNMFTEVDHDRWRPARKGVATAFSQRNVARMAAVCQDHVDRWMEEFLCNDVTTFDPAVELTKMTVPILCDAVLDYTPPKEESEKFMHEHMLSMDDMMKQTLNPLYEYFRPFSKQATRGKEAKEWLRSFARSFIDAYHNNPNPTPGSVIERIVQNEEAYKDDDARISEVMVFLTAGFDSTGFTLAWALRTLAQHPNEQEKLRQALLALPESERTNSPALQNVIRESIRLNPIASTGSARVLGRDFIVKGANGENILLPKGAVTFCTQVAVNRNPHIFSDRPDEFVPDRWLDEHKYNKAHVTPFSLGARNCVGQALANAELAIVIATLISRYTFELVEAGEPKNIISYRPQGTILRAIKRKE